MRARFGRSFAVVSHSVCISAIKEALPGCLRLNMLSALSFHTANERRREKKMARYKFGSLCDLNGRKTKEEWNIEAYNGKKLV